MSDKKKCVCGKDWHMTDTQMLQMKMMGYNLNDKKQVRVLDGAIYKVPFWFILIHPEMMKAEMVPTLGFDLWP